MKKPLSGARWFRALGESDAARRPVMRKMKNLPDFAIVNYVKGFVTGKYAK